MYAVFWDSVLFYCGFSLIVDCQYGLADVASGKSFEGPLEQGLVDYWKEAFRPRAADGS